MKNFIVFASVCLVSFMFIFNYGAAAPDKKPKFVGVKKCKTCHNKKKTGKQYAVWSKAKHSHAYEVLATEEAKKTAAKLGIEDPQKSGKCLKCHSTAYAFGEKLVSEKVTMKEGVSCESCHGAGSLYKKKKIMKNLEDSIAKGLHPTPKDVCVKCHNEESPNFKPFTDEMYEKIAHPNPQKAK